MKRKRSSRRFRNAALTLTATSTLLLAAAAGTASASPSTSSVAPGRVSVPQGISAGVIANSTSVSITASQTPVTVSFILKSPNLATLEADVTGGWGGLYLNTQQFAQQFGQPVSFIQELTSFLSSYHIHVTNVDADNYHRERSPMGIAVVLQPYSWPNVLHRSEPHSSLRQPRHGPLFPQR